MDFKIVNSHDSVLKTKHYYKDRNFSILEFQMRILDMAKISEIPIMERINFIKIVSSNLEEFISIRLPDVDEHLAPIILHTIEYLYNEAGFIIQEINEIHKINFEINDCYKKISNQNFQFIYSGEDDKIIENEMRDIIEIKNNNISFNILYCGNIDLEFENMDYAIHVPKEILLLDNYILYYKSRYDSDTNAHFDNIITEKVNYNYYDELLKRDIIIRTPYETYDHVLDFIDQMCNNKNIESIFISLYRTAEESRIINSLLNAKKSGKNVFVYMETTARGNEYDNLRKIRIMRNAGIHVNSCYMNYKVHCKLFCAIDKNFNKFVHIGTGNYNEKTENIYTDVHLLTTNDSTSDTALNILMSLFTKRLYKNTEIDNNIFSSPLNFRNTFYNLIKEETKKGENGKIFIKCNNLCDFGIIDKLYIAAKSGVKIKILCRTGCSIFPKENIEIRSKVGQYLEHDRVYIFGNQVYISSADLLLRNISKRVEILCKIVDENCNNKINTFMDQIWNSNYIHEMQPTGKWELRN